MAFFKKCPDVHDTVIDQLAGAFTVFAVFSSARRAVVHYTLLRLCSTPGLSTHSVSLQMEVKQTHCLQKAAEDFGDLRSLFALVGGLCRGANELQTHSPSKGRAEPLKPARTRPEYRSLQLQSALPGRARESNVGWKSESVPPASPQGHTQPGPPCWERRTVLLCTLHFGHDRKSSNKYHFLSN